MKKEIISFVIGTGIVGSIWCCKTFCESKPEAASVVATPEPQKNDVKNQQSSICPSETAIHVFMTMKHICRIGFLLFLIQMATPKVRLQTGGASISMM